MELKEFQEEPEQPEVIAKDFIDKITTEMQELEPEIQEAINKGFWDMITPDNNPEPEEMEKIDLRKYRIEEINELLSKSTYYRLCIVDGKLTIYVVDRCNQEVEDFYNKNDNEAEPEEMAIPGSVGNITATNEQEQPELNKIELFNLKEMQDMDIKVQLGMLTMRTNELCLEHNKVVKLLGDRK